MTSARSNVIGGLAEAANPISTPIFSSPETLFNTAITGDQTSPSIAALADGRALASYVDNGALKLRFIDASGKPDSTVTFPPSSSTPAILDAQTIGLSGGRSAVISSSVGQGANLGGVILDAQGRITAGFSTFNWVRSLAPEYYVVTSFSAAGLSDGNIIVSQYIHYNGDYIPPTDNYFSAAIVSGTTGQTTTIPISGDFSSIGDVYSAVADSGNGHFALAWDDGSGNAKLQQYNEDGSTYGAAIAFGGVGPKSLATLASGRLVEAWTANGHIYAQSYDPTTSTAGSMIEADDPGGAAASEAKITTLRSGGFVVSWTVSTSSDAGNIAAREFTSDGTPAGSAFGVNTVTAGIQNGSTLAEVGNGSVVALWSDNSNTSVVGQPTDGSGLAVKLQDVAFSDADPANFGVTLDTPASGTTSLIDQFIAGAVTGLAASVVLYDNGVATATLAVDASGHFATSVNLGADGVHDFSVKATSADGRSVLGNPAVVTLDSTANSPLFGSLPLPLGSAGGEVYALYDGFLNRAPDAPGYAFWVNQIQSGTPIDQIVGDFLLSNEFVGRYGLYKSDGAYQTLPTATFATDLYKSVLHRDPDPDGLNNMVAALNGGLSRESAAANITFSPEHQAQIQNAYDQSGLAHVSTGADVAHLYFEYLDRIPDKPGLIAWNQQIASGALSFDQVAADFAASDEFLKLHQGTSNADFLTALYQGALGRAPDAPGLQSWLTSLDNGASRAFVALAFGQGAEGTAYATASIAAFHLL